MPRGNAKSSPLIVGTLSPAETGKPAETDREGITRTLEAYIRAWFLGDAEGMEACLHPAFTANVLQIDPRAADGSNMRMLTRSQGILATLGACTHPMAGGQVIAIHEISGHTASARAVLGDWAAYVHLSRTGERWAIVNVMWEWLSSGDRRSA